MAGRSLLHLQRAVLDGKALLQRPHDVVHESVTGVSFGHYQMDGQDTLGCTHAPDMQIVKSVTPGHWRR